MKKYKKERRNTKAMCEEEKDTVPVFSTNAFENYRSELVTTIGFLIGIRDDLLDSQKLFDKRKLAELHNNEDALIIRHLSRLRNQLLKN